MRDERRVASDTHGAVALRAGRRPGRQAARITGRYAPSIRSVVVCCAALIVVAGAYTVARQSSLFAVRTIELRGAKGSVAGDVRRALAGWQGKSLVGLDGADLIARVESVPWVASARFDRAFPHTLRIAIRPERPVAVLRRGRDSWLVSPRGRVLVRVTTRTHRNLPRIWVRTATPVELGERLPPSDGGTAARSLAPLLRTTFPARIATVVMVRGELFFALRSGVQLRLGRPVDVGLKLAIARRIVRRLPGDMTFLDVSVPERPVAGGIDTPAADPESQVSG
jgi:cell division protein FtsQ